MKFAIFGFLLVTIVGGVGYIVAVMGLVPVPGISPHKYGKPLVASSLPAPGFLWTISKPVHDLASRQLAEQRALAASAAVVTAEPPPKPQPDVGNAKLATLWNDMDVDKLALVTAKWQAPALAKILLKMDPDQVIKLLDAIATPRADALSRAIQAEASKPVPPLSSGA